MNKKSFFNKCYPFFLDNNDLGSAFYLYQVVSPALGRRNNPLISLKAVGEKTRQGDLDDLEDLNLISTIKPGKNPIVYLSKDIINRDKNERKRDVRLINMGEGKFPAWDYNNLTTKTIILGLRESLRNKFYKLTPGKKVDVLLTYNKFGVFEIKGKGNDMWLELKGVYSINDPGMMEKENYTENEITKLRFNNITELSKAIKQREIKALGVI